MWKNLTRLEDCGVNRCVALVDGMDAFAQTMPCSDGLTKYTEVVRSAHMT